MFARKVVLWEVWQKDNLVHARLVGAKVLDVRIVFLACQRCSVDMIAIVFQRASLVYTKRLIPRTAHEHGER